MLPVLLAILLAAARCCEGHALCRLRGVQALCDSLLRIPNAAVAPWHAAIAFRVEPALAVLLASLRICTKVIGRFTTHEWVRR